jgi:hypothetical protein
VLMAIRLIVRRFIVEILKYSLQEKHLKNVFFKIKFSDDTLR